MKHEDLQRILLELATGLDEHLNPGRRKTGKRKIGFLMCAFEFGGDNAFAYLSNAKPSDLRKAMVELIDKLEATGVIVTMPDKDKA